MMRITLGQVQNWTGGKRMHCDASTRVQKLTIDSREAGPGVLFAALPGTRTNGHEFVRDVWAAGGVALVRDDFADRTGPQIRVPSPLNAMGHLLRCYIDDNQIVVVGVTGSVGKTSIKELSTAVLRQRYSTTSSLGNYNTVIGLPLSFFAGDPNTTHFVAEMGMRGSGEIRQLTRIAPPDVAVISTIGPSHLEMMGSMQAIQAAKGEILEGLKPGGLAVLNADNRWVRELGEQQKSRVAWFGRTADADVRIESAEVGEDATNIGLRVAGQLTSVRLPWLGAHHAYNVAAVILVGLELGMSLHDVVAGVEQADRTRSRIHVLSLGDVTVLEDVYNASPLSAKAALDVLAGRSGRRIAVLGDMLELGAEEISGHQEVGSHAVGRVDRLLAVGPRAQHTFATARAAGVDAWWVPSCQEAADWLKSEVQSGDVILLKASRGLQFEWLKERLAEWRTSR